MFWKRKRRPYTDYLPEPPDATINMLKQVIEQRVDIPAFALGLSHLESPSSRLAIELYQVERYGQKHLEVGVADIQEPDPRVPHRPVDFVLWTYEGTDPVPALPEPAPEVARRAADLAAIPYDLTRWTEQSRQLALQLGVQGVPDLLCTMVHPPRRPAKIEIWTWLYHLQVGAAFIIACIDGGWEGSVRKSTLTSLAYGPMDWTVGAAVLALHQIAQAEPSSRVDIGLIYVNLLESMPSPGGVPYLGELLWCVPKLLPLLPESSGVDIARRALAVLEHS